MLNIITVIKNLKAEKLLLHSAFEWVQKNYNLKPYFRMSYTGSFAFIANFPNAFWGCLSEKNMYQMFDISQFYILLKSIHSIQAGSCWYKYECYLLFYHM